METVCSLHPRQVARQAHLTGNARLATAFRPRRGVSTFSGSRRTLRPRLFACVATADVEQVEEVESSEAAAAPAEAVEPAQPQENTDSRRRSRPPQQGRRPPRKDVIYSINDLIVGQEVDATVVGVTTYGAFVDYGGGKDALIHISQLKDGFVENTTDVVQVGDEVKARVINVDVAANKVGLTLRTAGDRQQRGRREGGDYSGDNGAPARQQKFDGQRRMPGQGGARQGGDRAPRTPLPAVGDEVTGKVNRTAAYGVFVDLENNIRGLLHVDEVTIAEGDSSREPNLRAMFSEGEEIKVRVIRVDAKSRKVDLSQRSEEERAADKKLAEKGAGTIRVAGMNQLQAALARAGIQKTDFVDLSKAPEEEAQAAAAMTPKPEADASPVAAEATEEPAVEEPAPEEPEVPETSPPTAEAAEEPAAVAEATTVEEPAPEEPDVPEATKEAIAEAAEEVEPEAVTIAEPEQTPEPAVEAALAAEAAPVEEVASVAAPPADEASAPAEAPAPVEAAAPAAAEVLL